MRVLIVDPDARLARLLKVGLQVGFYEKAKRLARDGQGLTDGLEVEQVGDPAAALGILAGAVPRVDLIFVDLRPEVGNWLDFLETCRRDHRDRYGEIIVVADRGSEAAAREGLAAGAKGVLPKPFTPDELVEHVFAAWREPGAHPKDE
jgi:DNA-binding response OmpR family regulator